MKKLAETDAIFDRLAQINPAADADETVLRLSGLEKYFVRISPLPTLPFDYLFPWNCLIRKEY